ncbi:MAG: hypothetical protein QM607_09210 [Microbacterium sp.]
MNRSLSPSKCVVERLPLPESIDAPDAGDFLAYIRATNRSVPVSAASPSFDARVLARK